MKESVNLDDWEYLLSLLPADYAQRARELGTFERKREIESPDDLLRLVLGYAIGSQPSLRLTAAWAQSEGIGTMSQVAVLKRVRKSADWLCDLVNTLLKPELDLSDLPDKPYRVRLVDASVLTVPGSKGTDYRLHAGFNLRDLALDHLEVTDASGGESLQRFTFEEGDLVLMDRCYPHRAGLCKVRESHAHFLGRFGWNGLPLEQQDGAAFDLFAHLRKLPKDQIGDWEVKTRADIKAGIPALAVRVIALRKSPQARNAAVRKLRKEARRKGRTPDARTLEAAGYVFVVTSLDKDKLSPQEALALYRLRWQIELCFKRLKSLLCLDALPCKDKRSVRAFLYSKLLLALLVRRLQAAAGFSPWGYGRPGATRIAMAIGEPLVGGIAHGGPGSQESGMDHCELGIPGPASQRHSQAPSKPTSPGPLSILPCVPSFLS
jgi:hypothetical protein